MVTDIRPATPADIPHIRAVALKVWPVAYSRILSAEQLEYMLELMYSTHALMQQLTEHGHLFLLATRAGTVIGFAGYQPGYRTRTTRLHKLYVLPEAQGSGVGDALLRGVLGAARSQGDGLVELNVNRFNPALRWYAKRGFNITRDEVIDIGHGYVMDDHVMVRSV